MELNPGTNIGPYVVEREIGRGGMGVVYLARDPRLNRAVAIKMLPEHLAADKDRMGRFESEARTLAQVNHSSVAGLLGLEEMDGQKFLILEYVEGETLSDRLERGVISLDEALEIGIKIAAGVEAAHEAGIIHRDLKPDNIRLTPDGDVKVLDFGLAKMEDGTSTSFDSSLTQSPTMTPVAGHSPTIPGIIMGTAGYMSPEQARGRRVDKRTDIWSFGVLLYEILTGVRPFLGETVSDSIGAILHKDVDLSTLPADSPPMLARVLKRCLERDKVQRYHDIGDVRLDLENLEKPEGPGAPPDSSPTSRLLAALLGVVALVAVAGWLWSSMRGAETFAVAPVHLSIALPDGMEVTDTVAITRDGTTIAFSGRQGTERYIYVRRLDDFTMRRLPDSRNGSLPVFSPDGRDIAYWANEVIYRASVDGGASNKITEAKWFGGAVWGEDGNLIFSEGVNSPLWVVSAAGGPRTPFTDLAVDSLAYAHVWPQRIEGTNKMLLTCWAGGPNGGPRLLDLDTGTLRLIDEPTSDRANFHPPVRWSPSGHLIEERWNDGLSVLPFDPDFRTNLPRAASKQLLENVYNLGSATRSVFALSDNGTLVYVPGRTDRCRLVWVEENGDVSTILDQLAVADFTSLNGKLSLSGDDKRVLAGGAGDILLVDLERSIPRRLTIEGGNDVDALWSRDGQQVVFASNRQSRWGIWLVGVDTGSQPEQVYLDVENTWPQSIAPDGTILIRKTVSGRASDLVIREPSGDVRDFQATQADEQWGVFSIDGRWIAYSSNVTGQYEVFVARADGSGTPIQVSRDGGNAPLFGPSGRTLYFRQHRAVLRVGFEDGAVIGDAEQVFKAPNLINFDAYDLSSDEKRLIAVQLDDIAVPTEIRVVTGFFEIIRQIAAGQP